MSTVSRSNDVAKIEGKQRSRSLWQMALRYLLRDRLTLAALAILVILTVGCIVAPPVVENVTGFDANRTNVLDRYLVPGMKGHMLGTDQLGRDQLLRLLYGGRISLFIAYIASLMSISIGVVLGIISGYFGGFIDDAITWFTSTLSSIPTIFLLILAATVFSPSPGVLILLLGLLGWISTCRLARGEVLTLKEQEYIQAARAVGASTPRIMSAHILPNLLSQIIVALTLDAGGLILVESSLSFLGLGVQQPTPSWGNMLTESRTYFATGIHLVIWPGIMITMTVLCFYILGDGLRDALDPRVSRR